MDVTLQTDCTLCTLSISCKEEMMATVFSHVSSSVRLDVVVQTSYLYLTNLSRSKLSALQTPHHILCTA